MIIAINMVNISCAPAQNQEEKNIKMIKEFYTAYITEVSSNDPPMVMAEKLDSLQKIYCTDKLLDRLPDIIEKTGADAFLKAQDSNIKSLETLTIKKDSTKPNGYIVSYSDPYSKTQITIGLTVIEKKSRIKIDSIW